MNKKKSVVFRSRISVLFIGIMLATSILVSVPLALIGAYAVCAIIVMLLLLLVTGCRYVIVDDKLVIKIFWIIPYLSVKFVHIVSVQRSYELLVSPAASQTRLCILFKKKLPGYENWMTYTSCLVSPIREWEFLAALKSANPNINTQVSDKWRKWSFWEWDL
jgi:hypothetical protein